MLDIGLGGLFTGPVSAIQEIKDERLKHQMLMTGLSIAYSQYITALYSLGTALSKRKFIGWVGPVFINMAASMYKMLALAETQKVLNLSVPEALVKDTVLLDSIFWEEIKQP